MLMKCCPHNFFVVDTFGINSSMAAMELINPPRVSGQPSTDSIPLEWTQDRGRRSDAMMYLVALEEQPGPAVPVFAVCCQ